MHTIVGTSAGSPHIKRLLLAAAAALTLASPAGAFTFSYTGHIVTWTAPQDGLYEIVAVGAQGGGAWSGVDTGGFGALIGGIFPLPAGTALQLAVGQMGSFDLNSGSGAGGGGGGSFNADTVTGWSQRHAGSGNGSITITLQAAVATPEPASASLAALGLFALAALRRRR